MMYDKIVRLLADILDLYEEDITPDMELTPEFEVERLHIAKLVIECEKSFKVTIHDEDVADFRRVKDVADYIENAQYQNSGNAKVSSDEERFGWYYA